MNRPRPRPLVATPAQWPAPTHEQIARRAKRLWESYGKPVGRDEEIWLEAEREARQIANPASTTTGSGPLKENPDQMETAVERIQEMADRPRGTEQVIR